MIAPNIVTNSLEGCVLRKALLISLILLIILSSGCSQKTPNPASNLISTSNPTPTNPSQQKPAAQGRDFEITPQELAERLAQDAPLVLVDIREPQERSNTSIPGTTHTIPLTELEQRLGELDKEAEIVLYCRVGRRSALARDYMARTGFENVRSLKGGIKAWVSEVDRSVPVD